MTDTKINIEITLADDHPDGGQILTFTEQEARELQRELNRVFGIPNPKVASDLFAPPIECEPSPTVAPNWGGQQPSTCCGDGAPRPMTAMEAVESTRQPRPVPESEIEWDIRNDLREDLRLAINAHSAENGSDTPDFILARYLDHCLQVFDDAVSIRTTWHSQRINPVTEP